MREGLVRIAALQGVVCAVIACEDGLVFDAVGSGVVSPESLAAEVTATTLAIKGMTKPLSSAEVHRFQFATDKYEICALFVGRLLLLAVAETGTTLRTIQIELAKVATELAQEEAKSWT
jgi:predicted regulator of Ras-like GTPase activity (Roadblock/LC7/MglB family)